MQAPAAQGAAQGLTAATTTTSPTRFELNDETEAQLLALFMDSPRQLERARLRFAKAKAHARRLAELRERLQMLEQRNRTLEASLEEASTNAGGHRSSVLAVAGSSGPPVSEAERGEGSPYQYSGPSGVVGVVCAVFPDGRLFRIETAQGDWVFYNDTRDHTMHVRYTLEEGSRVEPAAVQPGEDVAVTASRRVARRPGGGWEAALVVPPEQTAWLLRGTVAGFEDHCRAVRLSFDDAAAALDEAAERRLCAEAWAAWDALGEAVAAGSGSGVLPSIAAVGDDALSPAAVRASEAALDLCVRHRLPFVDPSFFPAHARLCRRGMDAVSIVPLHWRTPRAYLPASAQAGGVLFPSAISASQITGGSLLRDHNLLSVVAALTTMPGALTSLFTQPELGSAAAEVEQVCGAYCVWLCVDGWWRSVLLDAHLPATQHRPEFARCADDLRALWLPLLEKAFAKAAGSYAAILEAGVEDVAAALTGSVCCPLTAVWPGAGARGRPVSESVGLPKDEAPVAALRRVLGVHLMSPARGEGHVLLRTFPLSLAKTADRRDRLEEIYRTLGLVPGSSVLVRRLEVLSTGHAVVQLRQNAPGGATGVEDSLSLWRRLGRPWVDALWELELTSGVSTAEPGTLWVGLADVPQFFQEGYALYPTADWAGGEVRARGAFAGRAGAPSLSARVEVSAPTTVLCVVTPQAPRVGAGVGEEPSYTGLTHREGGKSVAADGGMAGLDLGTHAETRGVAVQVVERSPTDPGASVLLGSSTMPDIYALGETLQFAFHRDAAVALRLTPEGGPYYFVPRASPATGSGGASGEVPYVLAVLAKEGVVGAAAQGSAARVRVSFVELTPSAPLLEQARLAVGATALRPATHVKAVAAEYQVCRTAGEQQRLVLQGKGTEAA